MAGGPHRIPSRTPSLSPLAPMVLRLKAWESRSLPGLQSPDTDCNSCRHKSFSYTSAAFGRSAIEIRGSRWPGPAPAIPAGRFFVSGAAMLREQHRIDAGWSSPVARQAHNLKVVGSNPTPATNNITHPQLPHGSFFIAQITSG